MTDPNQPTVKYFDGIGFRVLPTVLSFEVAGLPYKEERIDFEEWGRTKGDTNMHPTNSLPVVTIAGTKLNQSVACAKFAAKAAGLEPQNPIEAGMVDEVEASLTELIQNTNGGIRSKQGREKWITECLPKWMGRIEALAKGDKYFLTGDRISIADFWIVAYVDFMAKFPQFMEDIPRPEDFHQFKKINRIIKNVKAHPAVALYYTRHPAEDVVKGY